MLGGMGRMSHLVIETKNLGLRLGNRYILKDINWTIKRGERWVVFGANGSGKTTLMSILAGYGYFSEGVLKVFGDPFMEDNVIQKRKVIGLVSGAFFERYYRQEAVEDIVLSGLSGALMHDMTTSDQDRQRMRRLLKALKIENKQKMPFSYLSKGERQNVLIARALIGRPQILILDEPAAGLDLYHRELLVNTVHDLAKYTDMTIIYITHYIEEIQEEFKQGVLLKNGRIYRQGNAESLFTSEVFSDFLDLPVKIDKDIYGRHATLLMDASLHTLLE